MPGNLFLRTSVVFLVIGVALGMFMGIKQDFVQAPTHAHLNLIGGVWMFLAGLFYNAHPHLSRKAVLIHYGLAVIAILTFVPGLYGVNASLPWGEKAVMVGATLAAIQFVYFAVMVFIGTARKA